jgi:hypothetical protein
VFEKGVIAGSDGDVGGKAGLAANEAGVKTQNESGRSETHLDTRLLGGTVVRRWLDRLLS